jgi:hypothetical protein
MGTSCWVLRACEPLISGLRRAGWTANNQGHVRRDRLPLLAWQEPLIGWNRFDIGEILRKQRGVEAPKSLRFIIGNPLIMKQMVEHVPDAASYASVTTLIDEPVDRVRLSYDRMASLLAPFGSEEALKVRRIWTPRSKCC